MRQTHLHSVAWRAPDSFYSLNDVQRELGHYGLEVMFNDGITGHEAITLLHLDCYSSLAELKSVYAGKCDFRQTLVMVNSNEQAIEVLGFLKDHDDVYTTDAPLKLIGARLIRMLHISRKIELELDPIRQQDPLTGMLTRWTFKKAFVQDFESDIPLSSVTRALVFFDLDRFKMINDCYGHNVGDEIIQEVAHLLSSEVGPADRVGRLGGDEFVLLLNRYNKQTVLDSVDRIRQSIETHEFKSTIEPKRLAVTASFGISILDPQSQFDEALRQADMAMYQAKKNGRNTVVCFDAMRDETSVEQDIYVQHFENVTRVVNERVTNLISLLGRRLIESAREEANNDALTQLHNRRYFDSRLSREFEMAKKHRRPLTVAFMDIDHFHDVNATYGWPTGDHVLKTFSKIASENIRLVDWIARYGGEEFCLIMLDTELEQGLTIAERIRKAVAALNVRSLDDRAVKLTVSIGVAELTDDIESPVALVQQASKALIHAKDSGRNRICYDLCT
jgi:two-component system cell cycle response regulator